MKKKLLLLALGCFLLFAQVFAQQKIITGKVTSSDDGGPIPGVSIKVKGTQIVSQTNKSGLYSIQAKSGDVLMFSYVGMLPQENLVGNSPVMDLALKPDDKALNEVIVTAFGLTREKKSLGYSAQTLKGSEIADTQRENFLNALQGRVAGATITPTMGTPGASATMIIRGGVSLDGDNSPLFVVDGMPISNRTFSEYNLVGQGTFNRQSDYGNKAMDINPDEIETITILKGPEAAAIYGTEGASGAVVITTKKAKSGATRVFYSNNFRVETTYRYPEVQTVYAGGTGGVFDEEQRTRTFFGSKYPEGKKMYDNIGNFYKTGFTQRHIASIEGGTDKLSLRAGVTYTDQTGVIPGTAFRSINGKISGLSKISDKITVNTSLNMISSRTDKTYKGVSSPMLSALSWPLTDDMRNYLTPLGERRTVTGSLSAELDNPYWGVNRNPNWDKNNRVLANVNVDYKPLDWLSMKGMVGADIYAQSGLSGYDIQSYEANKANTTNLGGSLNTYNANERLITGAFIATAKKDFGKFKPLVSVGTDIRDDSYQVNAQFGTKFYQPNFFSMNNIDPTTHRVAFTDELKRKVGVFGSANLGYDEFLYLTLTGRLDLTSTLPQKNYSFFYPSASVSFVFSELKPLKELSWLSFGKLRSSVGLTGKDARVAYITQNKLIAQQTTGGGYALDATMGNPNLEAEFTKQAEVGLEMAFFKNRLSFDFSLYQSTSDKQITAPRLSYGTGAVLQYINSGKIRSQGFEILVKGSPIRNKDFGWDISANASRNRGKILSLPAGQDIFYVSDTWLFDNVRAQYAKGTSISAFASFDFYRNDKGQLLINPINGMPIRDLNFKQFGDRAPDISLGLTNSFTYKNFNLSFLLDMRKGGDIYNATEYYLYTRGLSKLSLDREVPRIIDGVFRDGLENTANPTKNNVLVIPYITQAYYITYYNSADFIERDINWIRLKDLTLAYVFSNKIFANSKTFKSLSVSVTGTDLLLITNYKGVDPSVNGLSAAAGGLGGTGIDFGSVGLPRGLNFGVKVGF